MELFPNRLAPDKVAGSDSEHTLRVMVCVRCSGLATQKAAVF